MARRLYEHLSKLTTEASNPQSTNLDHLNAQQIVRLINSEDKKVAPAVEKVLPQVAEAVELVTQSFKSGGRLIYAGAGTSGRLGVLDASECPPTFGASPRMVQGIIAGGRRTLVRSREGVEDDTKAALNDIGKLSVTSSDTVLGIAASGLTPYPLAVLKKAKRNKAKTIFLVCNKVNSVPGYIDLLINPVLGPEVLTGSTRMKAGTACKMILNMITTAAMVQIGKCYGNLMVDLKASSKKLIERSKYILVQTTGISYRQATKLLRQSNGEVKTAIVMQSLCIDYRKAKKCLLEADGKLFQVLNP